MSNRNSWTSLSPTYLWAPFHELSGIEVHDLLALRQEVFVVEQQCLYQDVDGLDPVGRHLLAKLDGELCAYLRVLPPATRFPLTSIGRVVVRTAHRKSGIGRAIMKEALTRIEAEDGRVLVKLSAQAHLEGFYASLGFASTGERYDEDGIPHVAMVRS